jgi:hypothetical protein
MIRLSLQVFYLWRHVYWLQRRHLYYGGQIYKYYLPPSTADLPSLEGCAVKQFKQSTVRILRKNQKSRLYCDMSMSGTIWFAEHDVLVL